MAYNKVEANGETLIDLTSDTVTADTLVSGRTAHLASGEKVSGTFEPVTGVKGNAETNYRTGNVNLTPANIGAATAAQGTKADSAVQTIKMNGNAVIKTSGVVDLGTVITAHQDISGKADKSATVSTVTYDTTNKKLTKTINGNTTDVVTTAKLKTDMALSKSDVGLGNVGNFKAVSTAASQGLSDTEKANARTNIGLGNVDNTSDANKPISTATQAALDSQQEQINYNTNNGVKNVLSFSGIYTTDDTYFDSIAFDKFSGAIQATVKSGRAYSAINFPRTSLTLIDGKQYTMSAVVNSKTLPKGRMTLRRADTNLIIYGKSLNIGYNELDFTFNASDFPNGYYVSILLTEDTSQSGSIDISEYMIRESIIDDDTFEPYAKSNAELTQDLDDISEELDCLTIRAALVNNEVVIQNTGDFTNELYSKYFSYTKPKFAILELQISSNTYYYKALLNSSFDGQWNFMEASFITVANGEYIYNFTWTKAFTTVGTPTVTRKALNLGS